MFADTQPAQLDAAGGADPWSAFRVQHPRERLALLRQLRDGAVPVQLAGANGSALTTTMWSADEQGLAFAVDSGSPQVQGLVDADECVAVAYLDAVKLQFDCQGLVRVQGPQATILRSAPPQVIYRFQRRQAYRVRTDERQGPRAVMRHPSLPEMTLVLRVLDVSVGGCALWQPDDMPPLPAGTRIEHVDVTLDPGTRLAATLTLHHVTGMGGRGRRIGCEWHLSAAAERSLQLWIDQAQKRRRLLTLG